jgi:hypothetical protein
MSWRIIRRWGLAAMCGLGLWGCGREPLPQAESCRRFVECVRAQDAQRGMSTNLVRFEPGGGCWGGPEGAHLCEQSCTRGLEVLRRHNPALPATCTP